MWNYVKICKLLSVKISSDSNTVNHSCLFISGNCATDGMNDATIPNSWTSICSVRKSHLRIAVIFFWAPLSADIHPSGFQHSCHLFLDIYMQYARERCLRWEMSGKGFSGWGKRDVIITYRTRSDPTVGSAALGNNVPDHLQMNVEVHLFFLPSQCLISYRLYHS